MRYPVLEFRSTSQTDHRTFFQYYGLTIFTVFFYDYLLTLEDEVRQEAPSPQLQPLTEAALQDQIFLAWKEEAEYVRCQQWVIPSADIRAAFLLLIAVRIFALHDIVLVLTLRCRIGTFR